jgi:hypothetical protein
VYSRCSMIHMIVEVWLGMHAARLSTIWQLL